MRLDEAAGIAAAGKTGARADRRAARSRTARGMAAFRSRRAPARCAPAPPTCARSASPRSRCRTPRRSRSSSSSRSRSCARAIESSRCAADAVHSARYPAGCACSSSLPPCCAACAAMSLVHATTADLPAARRPTPRSSSITRDSITTSSRRTPRKSITLDSGRTVGWTRTGRGFTVFPSQASGGPASARSAASTSRRSMAIRISSRRRRPSAPTSSARSRSIRTTATTSTNRRTCSTSSLPDSGTGACPADTVPVYRLWNQRADSNHRYTTDPGIKTAMLAKDYVAEGYGPGVAMCSTAACWSMRWRTSPACPRSRPVAMACPRSAPCTSTPKWSRRSPSIRPIPTTSSVPGSRTAGPAAARAGRSRRSRSTAAARGRARRRRCPVAAAARRPTAAISSARRIRG